MRIDSSGRVGIGTDSPAAPLDVNGNVYIRETGVLYVNTLSGYTSNVITLNSNTNFIVPSGNVGIGTTSPDFKLSLNGGMRIENTSPSPNTGSGTEYGYNTSANEAFQITRTKGVGTSTYRPFIHRAEYISFQTGTTSSTERMRITSGGVIQNNSLTTTQSSAVRFSNDGFTWGMIIEDDQVNNGLILFSAQNGDSVGSITRSGLSTSFNTVSDYRLKEDLQDFAGLDMVSKIPVYDFKWKSEESRSYGVMAHELQEVLPDAVTGKKDAKEMQGVDYSKIVPLLVKSIQELKAEIELLKTQINN